MLTNMNVRFFVYGESDDNGEFDIIEVSESEWLSAVGEIIYEHHTVRENGVNQICLTKTNGY